MKKASKELSKRFYTGLVEYNLTKEEIENGDWVYAGGDQCGAHLNYFKIVFPEAESLPEHEDHCVCNHPIKWNCYIRHKVTNEVIVLGNCCIKKFIPKSMRTCGMCGEPHKNRKDNYCNDCRKHLAEQKRRNKIKKVVWDKYHEKKKPIVEDWMVEYEEGEDPYAKYEGAESIASFFKLVKNVEESVDEIKKSMDEAFL